MPSNVSNSKYSLGPHYSAENFKIPVQIFHHTSDGILAIQLQKLMFSSSNLWCDSMGALTKSIPQNIVPGINLVMTKKKGIIIFFKKKA